MSRDSSLNPVADVNFEPNYALQKNTLIVVYVKFQSRQSLLEALRPVRLLRREEQRCVFTLCLDRVYSSPIFIQLQQNGCAEFPLIGHTHTERSECHRLTGVRKVLLQDISLRKNIKIKRSYTRKKKNFKLVQWQQTEDDFNRNKRIKKK